MAHKVSKNKTAADNASPEPDGGLSVLFPPQKEITLRGESFTLREWSFGEIGFISENFSPLVNMLLNIGVANLNEMMLLAVLMRNAELTNGLLAYSIKKEVTWVKAASLAEGAKAAVELVRLNIDFFRLILEIFQGMGVAAPHPETTAGQAAAAEAEITSA